MPDQNLTGNKRSSKDPRVVGKLCEYMTFSAKEAFKRLRTNVLLAFPEEEGPKCRVIGVTSAQVSEGKSTVSINLAYSLAELGKSVILIDGDMRRPTIHKKLNMRSAPGLSELLAGDAEINNAVQRYTSSSDSTVFDAFISGEVPANPSELLTSARFKKFIEVVSQACDYIIIDLPPVNVVVDAISASEVTDGMIVVLRENHCPRFVLNDCMEQLKYAKANVLGFVLNGSAEGSGKRHQYNQQYYNRYQYYK